MIRRFRDFACIDWSGQAVSHPKGIALALSDQAGQAPRLIAPPGGWSRMAMLQWLIDAAKAQHDLLIGIDFSAALPFLDQGGYFPGWPESPLQAGALWAMIDALCEAEPHLSANTLLDHPATDRHFRYQRGGQILTGAAFPAGIGRLRQVEHLCRAKGLGNAVSCFNLVGAAQVGKSSLTGMRLLHRLRGHIPVWPFDPLPRHGPVIVEIYTSLAARAAGRSSGRSKMRDATSLNAALAALDTAPITDTTPFRLDDHATDAILTAAWLRHAAGRNELWHPSGLNAHIAATEGWTFGVP